jgi:septal ring factor EnvC (AmiA/AmiB activator)
MAAPPKRIGELEDKLKQAAARIKELKAERDEAQQLVDEMRAEIEKGNEILEQWREAFGMVFADSGMWRFPRDELLEEHERVLEENREMINRWNCLVPRFNATILARDIGRPLAASEAQQAQVRQLRKAGRSLRAITKATGLGLQTVRTIIDKPAGEDRTAKLKGVMRRRQLDKARMATWRARKRVRDGLPKWITEHQKKSEQLIKAAKGLGKQ